MKVARLRKGLSQDHSAWSAEIEGFRCAAVCEERPGNLLPGIGFDGCLQFRRACNPKQHSISYREHNHSGREQPPKNRLKSAARDFLR